jgi:hypothetical protein
MTTLGKITEQIFRLYNGGDASSDQEIGKKEIELLVLQAVNKLLKVETLQVNYALGDSFPPHTAIASYDNVAVTALNDDFCKATLPAQPLSLPRGMGLWSITKRVEATTGSGVYIDDFEAPFIPMVSGQIGIISGIGHTGMKDVLLSNVIPYELRSNTEILFYSSRTDVGATVNIKLLVADPDKVSSTDTLPVGSDQEMQIIQEVLQILGVVPTATDEVANANKQI